jgi:hypothetical protein
VHLKNTHKRAPTLKRDYPKNRKPVTKPENFKLDSIHRSVRKKEKVHKPKSYADLIASIKKLESLSWDHLDPSLIKVSPLNNPTFTPAVWWFYVCANYFKRKIYKLSPENLIKFVTKHLSSIELRPKLKDRPREQPKPVFNPFKEIFSVSGSKSYQTEKTHEKETFPGLNEQNFFASFDNKVLAEDEAKLSNEFEKILDQSIDAAMFSLSVRKSEFLDMYESFVYHGIFTPDPAQDPNAKLKSPTLTDLYPKDVSEIDAPSNPVIVDAQISCESLSSGPLIGYPNRRPKPLNRKFQDVYFADISKLIEMAQTTGPDNFLTHGTGHAMQYWLSNAGKKKGGIKNKTFFLN